MNMNGAADMGRLLIMMGLGLAIVGLVLVLGGKLGLGRLPGDIIYRKGNLTFYAPIVTSLLLSLLLTLILSLFRR